MDCHVEDMDEEHEQAAEDRGASVAGFSGRVGPQQLVDRTDYLRLLQQAMRKLGYNAVADRLEQESGVAMQPDKATRLQEAVMKGCYDEAVQLLPQLIQEPHSLKQATFRILQQKYVEQVMAGNTQGALLTLRQDLAPMQINSKEIKRLSGYLLHQLEEKENGLLRKGAWSRRKSDSREQVIKELQHRLSPGLLIPEGRLEHLIELALQSQIDKCIYHNSLNPRPSLMHDYQVGREELPIGFQQKLLGHQDEVWHVQFSHSGDRLASASKDRSAIIWAVPPNGDARMLLTLKGHPDSVTHLSWSRDDTKLLTCSSVQVNIWNTLKGECLQTVSHHTKAAAACAWFPDGAHFLTAGLDKKIFMCNLAGQALRQWSMKERVNDLVLTPDAQVIVCVTADRFIELMRLKDYVPVASIGEEVMGGPTASAITSITITPDGEYLLANFRDHTTHLWKLGPIVRRILRPLPEGNDMDPYGLAPEEEEDDDISDKPLMEYHAGDITEGRYVIRSCFGGLRSAFVASGSEDSRIYIWHRDSGTDLGRLEGHSGTVNGVSWNPVHPYMLASASDDQSIGIWLAPSYTGKTASFRG